MNSMRLLQTLALILLSPSAPASAADAPAPKWNFVYILTDDLGWTDLSCMGSEFYETPNIDRLAAQGMKFTQAYAACTVCSPTRAALLTGKYPARLHVTDWIEGHKHPKARLQVPDWTMHLPLEEYTIAEALRGAGYATASIGKWHLGGPSYYPEKQGFDQNIGGYERGQPPSYFAPYKIPTLAEGPTGEFLTDRESAEAVKFITSNRDRPFFLYLPHYAVHQPIAGKQDVIAKYQRKVHSDYPQHNATYAALVESVDDSVGRILKTLDELNLADRTVVVFSSDNGGLTLGRNPPTSNLPLRAGKGSAYEGGVRVPLIVKWPGVTAPGSTNDMPVITPDAYPTFLEIAGIQPQARQIIDGHSLVPLLRGGTGFQREAIYWHYPHYHPGGATPYGAVRAGNFKLIEFYEDEHVEMYDLRADLGETNNLANQFPAKANELRQMLGNWRRSVNAQMPVSNPDFDPAREKLPSHVVQPGADGGILLEARTVEIHGTNVRYEPQPHKNTIGYWTRSADWVSWDFFVARPGTYRVEILQGCGPRSGGSDVEFKAAGQSLPITVIETKGFQDFLPRDIGALRFDKAGRYTLSVKPKFKPGAAVMDLRQVKLMPEK